MSGRGKGGKGLGKGGAKRHRKILRDNIQGITKPAIRRLARRGGVKRISGLIYEETRGVLKVFLENVIRDSVTYTEHAKRKTVTALDVVYALKRQGRILYGFAVAATNAAEVEKSDRSEDIGKNEEAGKADKKAVRGQWRKDEKAQEIPENKMIVVFPCIMAAIFLAALDSTIVATALPSISAELQMSSAEYSWVGSAFMMCSTAVIPLVARIGSIIGEKVVFIVGILVFLLGSGLCGGAKTGFWLCIARGVQGLGGGTILSSVQIIISLITKLENRGKYSGLIGSVWGIASVLGPLIGGAFTENVNWNWCFWVNLPIGGAVLVALTWFLKLNPTDRPQWKDVLKQFDFVGLFLIIAGAVCLILGFSFASTDGFQAPGVIALIVVGGVLIIVFGVWEMYTTKVAIVPPRLFKTMTTTSILIGNFAHAVNYMTASYFLPVYFQVSNEASALDSGIQLLPFTLGASVVSIIAGLTVARFKKYRLIIWVSWTIQVLGYGLMTSLRNDSNRAKQVLYLLVAALGVGGLFQTPLLAMQAAVPIKDMAQSTGAYVFVRSLGGCIGISVGGVMMSTISQKKLRKIPNIGSLANLSTEDITRIKHIQPDSLKLQIQAAWARGVSSFFILAVVLAACGLLSSLFIKRYSMYINNVKSGEKKEEDTEKQQVEGSDTDHHADEVTTVPATASNASTLKNEEPHHKDADKQLTT
ncbi:hypothetical protein E3P99_03372 [Wallemia hederae]|uniref:Histone H4 n=3 Tax=Wallemia TaxID=148959 RepID=A0A4V4LSQ2_9BASI|nr:hypothetical protein E3P99_03372 [Wallemia hederae]